jgi:MFS family permease
MASLDDASAAAHGPGSDERTATIRNRGTFAAILSSFVFPLALTQFIASYAGSNMNVAITSIADDLGTTMHGVQTAITLLIVGYSLLEGIGSALMIPPVYIILTVAFADLESRAKAFGIVSAAAGLGAAAGPLIGGLLTSAISWRASFIAQVIVVLAILAMSRKFKGVAGAQMPFDLLGAVLSAAGLVFVVLGILQSGNTAG